MKKYAVILVLALLLVSLCSCAESGARQDIMNTTELADRLQENQPTPNDIEYSLERYNLIRRTYWVNGMRERAASLPCEVERPLGYIVLFSGNAAVGQFVVDGKVSSLNSFLTPDSEYYEKNNGYNNKWLADVDGSYGENDSGIFFFTPDGKYIEWSGDYLYSDIPFTIDAPIVQYKETN